MRNITGTVRPASPVRRGFTAVKFRRGFTASRFRRAFTLIELVIVIAVIAILAAVLLPAVMGASGAAQGALVVADIDDLSAALQAFKQKHGTFPPSSLLFYESAAGWEVAPASIGGMTPAQVLTWREESRRALSSIWPQLVLGENASRPDLDGDSVLGDIDLNNDGDVTDVHQLNGAECLLFFLQGIPFDGTASGSEYAFTGFSVSPLNPFAPGTSNREGPYFEASSSRMVNVDAASGDQMPEYVDRFEGQAMPIQYFVPSRGGVYRPQGPDNLWGTADDERINDPRGLAFAYYKSVTFGGADVNGDGTIEYNAVPINGVPWSKDSYQLISPGPDGDFGTGGTYLAGEGRQAIPDEDYDFNPTVADSGSRRAEEELDNISNFAEGRLQ